MSGAGAGGGAGAGVVTVQKLEAAEGVRTENPASWRMRVWSDTYARSTAFPYQPSHKMVYNPTYIKSVPYNGTNISVTPEDTLDAARRLLQAGLRPVVLNFADDEMAGGNVMVGSGAQEESLWRRTNLCQTQLQRFYPLLDTYDVEGIYTPLATVFKSSEAEGYAELAEPWGVAVASVPAIPYPSLEEGGRMGAEDTALFRKKIELVLQIANRRGHDSVVLGAFGCGAWRGPPQQIAELFRDAMREWRGAFRAVVFACLHRGDSESVRRGTYRGNYEVFSNVLAWV